MTTWRSGPRSSVFATVVRRAGPRVVEASLVPSALFYGMLVGVGLGAAFVAACTWVYGTVALRVVRRRPVPGLVVLAAVGISVKTTLAVWSGSTFVYFAQPVLASAVTATLFLGSCWTVRPMVARMACDFWPLTADMLGRPRVVRLFRHLTLWWALVNFTIGAATFVLLVTLPVATFVVVRQGVSLALMTLGVAVTIHFAVGVAHREGFTVVGDRTVAMPPVPATAPA